MSVRTGALLATMVMLAATFAGCGSGQSGSPGQGLEASAACSTTLTPSSGASTLASAIVSAPDGSTICLASGRYPFIHVVGAAHASYVTLRSAPGATATLTEGMEVANSSFLRVEGLHLSGAPAGIDMRDSPGYPGSRDYQLIDDTFEDDAYGIALDGAGAGPIKDVLIERDVMRNIDWAGAGCRAGYADGQAVTLEDSEGVTITHNSFKEVSWHFIQGGGAGPEGVTVEHNLFEGPIPASRRACTHLNVWQIFAGGENNTFANNIVRGEPGNPASITPLLFETETSSGKCTGTMSNTTVSNNLFVYADAAYSIQIMTTHGLTVKDNTVVGSKYGTTVYNEPKCALGTNYDVSHNIDVGNESGADMSLGGCEGACTFEYNVTEDASAERAGGAGSHYVVDWSPSWASTSWDPTKKPSVPTDYYHPIGLPFWAGYEGSGSGGP